jgi:catechol 2,3-dioxygenase-like lactoylglutathione lyase family enzyme
VLRLDHVVYAVADLEATAKRWRRELGLDSAEGGRHAGWGTANRIVPLGESYVELIGVVDDVEARSSTFGRTMLDRVTGGDGWFMIVASADHLDAVAARLGLEVTPGSRLRPDGIEVRWRAAGFEDPRREPWMPFFIQWDVPPERHPGRLRAAHGTRVRGLSWVEVAGDAERLRAWLGDEELPIRVVQGSPGIRAVALARAGGELVIS